MLWGVGEHEYNGFPIVYSMNLIWLLKAQGLKYRAGWLHSTECYAYSNPLRADTPAFNDTWRTYSGTIWLKGGWKNVNLLRRKCQKWGCVKFRLVCWATVNEVYSCNAPVMLRSWMRKSTCSLNTIYWFLVHAADASVKGKMIFMWRRFHQLPISSFNSSLTLCMELNWWQAGLCKDDYGIF